MAEITGTSDWQTILAKDLLGRVQQFVVPPGKSVSETDTVYPTCWEEYNENLDYQNRPFSSLPKCAVGGTVTLPPGLGYVGNDDYVSTTPVTPPATADYFVRLDVNACDVISGWVINRSSKTTAAAVDITVDGAKLASVVANVSRPDVRDALIQQGVLPAGTTFDLYGYRLDKDDTFADGKPHTWRVFGKDTNTESTTENNTPNVVTCGVVKQVLSYSIPDAKVDEGGSVVMRMNVTYTDRTTEQLEQAEGTFAFVGDHPDSYYLGYGNTARVVVTTKIDTISEDTVFTIRFTGADGKTADGKLTVKNKASTTVDPPTNPPSTTLVIDKMAIYFPYGWHDTSFGRLSENLVLLVNVAGTGGANSEVFGQYAQSRNDATFGKLSKLDYSKNNVPPNILPDGYTHWTTFNDEQFSTALRTFRARITNVTNSQVQAVYQAPAATPNHTTAQIYPVSN